MRYVGLGEMGYTGRRWIELPMLWMLYTTGWMALRACKNGFVLGWCVCMKISPGSLARLSALATCCDGHKLLHLCSFLKTLFICSHIHYFFFSFFFYFPRHAYFIL